jgi:putative oxidoreductase
MNSVMTVIRLIARPMLASMFVVGGIDAIRNADALVERSKPVIDKLVPLAKRTVPQAPIPSDPKNLVRLNGAAQIVAGLALATGRVPRLSALVLSASMLPTTIAGHRFWEADDPSAKATQRHMFFKNVSMTGGLLLASVDTAGRPGLAWRARRAARDAQREARHARRLAKRDAKPARKNLHFG